MEVVTSVVSNEQEQKKYNRALILLAACATAGLTGTMYSWSVFSGPLAEIHGWAASSVSLAYSIYSLAMAIASFIAGWLQKRVPIRFLIFAGGFFLAFAWMSLGLVDSLPLLYIAFGVPVGLGCGMMYNIAVTAATKWYEDKKGFANGLCIGVVGLIPLAVAPLAGFVLEGYGLTIACFTFAFIPIVIVCSLGWFMRMPPENYNRETVDKTDVNQNSDEISNSSLRKQQQLPYVEMGPKQMLKTPLFWAIIGCFFVAATTGAMIVGHAATIGSVAAGMTASQGSLLVAILAVGNFLGRLGFGSLSDKIGRCPTLFVSLIITLFDALILLPAAHDFVVLAAAVVVAGACYGAVLVVMPSLCSDLFGSSHFSQNYSLLFFGFAAASFVGPLFGGAIFDSTGGYTVAFYGAAVFALVGIVLVGVILLLIKRRV